MDVTSKRDAIERIQRTNIRAKRFICKHRNGETIKTDR